jgi:predicted nucleic-acid-binding Zn-ribbon protein
MTLPERPKRCCPKCQATGYLFRTRKTVEEAEGKLVETKSFLSAMCVRC